uniref:MLP-like protein 423 n=1 Tax=Rhizophora mucronata TaxID=61149 RepID=A0A2P2J748_RHIMU
MACSGKLNVDIEVKSAADKFWECIRDSTTLFPKLFPQQYKSIEVLEGDGKAVGSVRLITYAEGSPLVRVSKEKIDFVDEGKKAVSYSVIDGDLLKYYKIFKGHLVIVPKGEGSLAKWSCEYEKASEDFDAPHIIKDFAVKNLQEVDEYIRNPKAN